eukprot:CAMPEP_0198353446 /NCGR_PEP_ID=MMETSP1450-20131203/111331_1 /TAXON_ID=753684 ORGANISM="Madagascaria erythrocladiodes, Strain CCMP3234" /NCGR_SAMPLE_ID=MMETSP1450 /ASSEMBLY_ACC=CAM_ASM_001115 /LENGTH=307 /DNA_ID=CAMNT_0044059581 /DNA_START=89 /DNA_END=1012 /DNA_ORIENTATION=-
MRFRRPQATFTVDWSLADGTRHRYDLPRRLLEASPGLECRPWAAADRRARKKPRRPARPGDAHAAAMDAFARTDENSPGEPMFAVIRAAARIPAKPETVYRVMTDPRNRHIFRNVAAVVSRRVLSEDSWEGVKVVEVVQRATWRFLLFRGSFDAGCLVTERKKSFESQYALTKSKTMKTLSGHWQIAPLMCDGGDTKPASRWMPFGRRRRAKSSHCRLLPRTLANMRRANASLVLCFQEVQPALSPPPPIDSYVRRIARKTLSDILADLQSHFVATNGQFGLDNRFSFQPQQLAGALVEKIRTLSET